MSAGDCTATDYQLFTMFTDADESLRLISYLQALANGTSTELYILWSELSRRKLSPTLAAAQRSYPDNAIGPVVVS